jgi:hypothetical protein
LQRKRQARSDQREPFDDSQEPQLRYQHSQISRIAQSKFALVCNLSSFCAPVSLFQVFFEKLTEDRLKEYGTSMQEYYSRTLSEPIDFTTIRDRITKLPTFNTSDAAHASFTANSDPSLTVKSFVEECVLLIRNALLFNPPNHPVHVAAVTLSHQFIARYIPHLRCKLEIPDHLQVCLICGSAEFQLDDNLMVACDSCGFWYHQKVAFPFFLSFEFMPHSCTSFFSLLLILVFALLPFSFVCFSCLVRASDQYPLERQLVLPRLLQDATIEI